MAWRSNRSAISCFVTPSSAAQSSNPAGAKAGKLCPDVSHSGVAFRALPFQGHVLPNQRALVNPYPVASQRTGRVFRNPEPLGIRRRKLHQILVIFAATLVLFCFFIALPFLSS